MSGAPSEYGPSWYDVERLLGQIQVHYHRKVNVQLGWRQDPHTERVYWVVVLQSFDTTKGKEDGCVGASYNFKGNDGAKTVTAALYMALVELDSKLGERQHQAKQTTLF
jgi:hypothetical protein